MKIPRKEIIRVGLLAGTKDTFVHIDSVPNGINCNCVCPSCGAPLVAKNEGQGGRYRKNVHHFAHDRGYEECGNAGLKTIHRMAQKILEETKSVMLPKYQGQYVQYPAELQSFEQVESYEVGKDEKARLMPDCVGRPFRNGDSLRIEIYCNHPMTRSRKEEIVGRKQYCIQIDFSDLLFADFSEEMIRERLLTSSEDRKWICHPEWDEEDRLRKEDAQKRREEKEKAEEAERERIAREQAEKQKREQDRLLREQHRVPTPSVTAPTHRPSVPTTQLRPGERDWVMYAKTQYGSNEAIASFFRLLADEYTRVTLKNSHPFVANELRQRCNELLPRTDIIAEVNKTYLVLLLSIWVLDKLNYSRAADLGKLFVENREIRKEIFRIAKQIGSIDQRPIDDTIVSAETENRDAVLQILRICYMLGGPEEMGS